MDSWSIQARSFFVRLAFWVSIFTSKQGFLNLGGGFGQITTTMLYVLIYIYFGLPKYKKGESLRSPEKVYPPFHK